MNDSKFIIKLEKHETKDIHDNHTNGELTVIWRDWDNILQNHPKMIYISSVNPHEIKGPHVHTKRDSYFTCIQGKVVFILKMIDGKYKEIFSDSENPIMVYVPKNVASAHINLSDKPSRILTLADVSWKPNDNEMRNDIFNDYDWNKWKNSSNIKN